jgi:hypothetical protein
MQWPINGSYLHANATFGLIPAGGALMEKPKAPKPDNCSAAAYFYVIAGQLGEMAQRDNMPTLAYLFYMAQQEAAEMGLQASTPRLDT